MEGMKKNLLLSMIITSYTMDRFNDICDLLDSLKREKVARLLLPLEINYFFSLEGNIL